MNMPPIVSPTEWETAREKLLVKEKELTRPRDALAGMMSADDVAEVVLFVLTRPRNHRILETAFRPMGEMAWG